MVTVVDLRQVEPLPPEYGIFEIVDSETDESATETETDGATAAVQHVPY